MQLLHCGIYFKDKTKWSQEITSRWLQIILWLKNLLSRDSLWVTSRTSILQLMLCGWRFSFSWKTLQQKCYIFRVVSCCVRSISQTFLPMKSNRYHPLWFHLKIRAYILTPDIFKIIVYERKLSSTSLFSGSSLINGRKWCLQTSINAQRIWKSSLFKSVKPWEVVSKKQLKTILRRRNFSMFWIT